MLSNDTFMHLAEDGSPWETPVAECRCGFLNAPRPRGVAHSLKGFKQ